MSGVTALLLVGFGSVAFRVLPLVGAARLPDAVSRAAAWAGIGILVAITVRAVLQHQDPALALPVPAAVVSVLAGLVLSALGRPMLQVLLAGAGTYALLSAGSWLLT